MRWLVPILLVGCADPVVEPVGEDAVRACHGVGTIEDLDGYVGTIERSWDGRHEREVTRAPGVAPQTLETHFDDLGNEVFLAVDTDGDDVWDATVDIVRDDAGREVERWAENADGDVDIVTFSTYDADGHLITKADHGWDDPTPIRAYSYHYDGDLLVRAEVDLRYGGEIEETLTYSYDADGRRLTWEGVGPNGGVTQAGSNEWLAPAPSLDRILRLKLPFGDLEELQLYDAAGRLVHSAMGDLVRDWTYDTEGNLVWSRTEQTGDDAWGEMVQTYQAEYDATGLILEEVTRRDLGRDGIVDEVQTTTWAWDCGYAAP